MDQVADGSKHQLATVSEVGAAVTQATASITEVTATAEEANAFAENVVRVVDDGPLSSAVLLDRDTSGVFDLAEPSAALRVEGTGYVRGDEPLWFQRLLYRGDRYHLHNETKGMASSAIELRLEDERQPA